MNKAKPKRNARLGGHRIHEYKRTNFSEFHFILIYLCCNKLYHCACHSNQRPCAWASAIVRLVYEPDLKSLISS